jgi:signal transduction histidine kinase
MAAREAASAERGWIAAELHDTVAHAVTMIVLQAAGARRIHGVEPEQVPKCLAAIENLGTQAMTELRQLLEVLRPTDPAASSAPTAGYRLGIKDLDSLVRRVRDAGVSARIETEGQPRDLPVESDLAVYRTVQEALTNISKHGGPGSTGTVRLVWGAELLTIQVVDDGRGLRQQRGFVPSTGHGLRGLRERLNLLGGQLYAGPEAQSGFVVTATLPIANPATGRRPAAGVGHTGSATHLPHGDASEGDVAH